MNAVIRYVCSIGLESCVYTARIYPILFDIYQSFKVAPYFAFVYNEQAHVSVYRGFQWLHCASNFFRFVELYCEAYARYMHYKSCISRVYLIKDAGLLKSGG